MLEGPKGTQTMSPRESPGTVSWGVWLPTCPQDPPRGFQDAAKRPPRSSRRASKRPHRGFQEGTAPCSCRARPSYHILRAAGSVLALDKLTAPLTYLPKYGLNIQWYVPITRAEHKRIIDNDTCTQFDATQCKTVKGMESTQRQCNAAHCHGNHMLVQCSAKHW